MRNNVAKKKRVESIKSEPAGRGVNPKPIRILMLEDSEEDANLIETFLRKNGLVFETMRVDSREEFKNALKKFKPEVILSDHTIPQFNSLEALKIVKAKAPQTPFILVTGRVNEEFAVACIKSGADDYILKSNPVRLPSAIRASMESRGLLKENTIIKKLNEEIESKNEEMKNLNNEKDRILSIVSHDLNHYLLNMALNIDNYKNLILKDSANYDLQQENGMSENVKETTPGYDSRPGKGQSGVDLNPDGTQELPKYISGLERTVGNMRKLLSDILTVNRIQSGIINPVYSLVNVGYLLDEVVERHREAALRKNINLELDNGCRERRISIDAGYFSIIADNLISNAIKFTYPGKNIWIAFNKSDKYALRVRDEGQGIPEKDLPNLYKRFHKLTTRPTQNEPSNGLGLSIVKELVEKLKWEIDCQSIAGKGTTFTVLFQ